MKTCTSCKKTLPVAEFNKQAKSPDGLSYYCKACSKNKNNHYNRIQKAKSSIRKVNEARKVAKYTDIKVEEGKQFKSAKDFLKFKRALIQKQKDAL